jgi:hypothetical protein
MKQYLLANRDRIQVIIFLILATSGIIIYGSENFLYSLISYYIVWFILQPCWWHYDLWHWGLIRSNNFVHSIHTWIYCIFFPHPPSGPIKVHLAHHKYFNTDLDQNTFKVAQGRFKHLINKSIPLRARRYKDINVVIPNFTFWKICEIHYLKIFIISNILLFLISPKLYIFLHCIPFLLGKLNLLVKLHDIVWHYNPDINFSNKLLMFPISFTDAYHVDHHKDPIVLNFGPGIVKWVNPQFYYLCLIDTSIRKEVFNFRKNSFVRIADK